VEGSRSQQHKQQASRWEFAGPVKPSSKAQPIPPLSAASFRPLSSHSHHQHFFAKSLEEERGGGGGLRPPGPGNRHRSATSSTFIHKSLKIRKNVKKWTKNICHEFITFSDD
jgi:hypothetical protein